jgi:hypothetical protein
VDSRGVPQNSFPKQCFYWTWGSKKEAEVAVSRHDKQGDSKHNQKVSNLSIKLMWFKLTVPLLKYRLLAEHNGSAEVIDTLSTPTTPTKTEAAFTIGNKGGETITKLKGKVYAPSTSKETTSDAGSAKYVRKPFTGLHGSMLTK